MYDNLTAQVGAATGEPPYPVRKDGQAYLHPAIECLYCESSGPGIVDPAGFGWCKGCLVEALGEEDAEAMLESAASGSGLLYY